MNREGELWLLKHSSAWSKYSSSRDEYYFIIRSENIGNGRTLHVMINFETPSSRADEAMTSIEYASLPWDTRKDRMKIE